MKMVYHYFESIDSTNSYALKHLKEFDRSALTVISAGAQTKGRGQRGRIWLSPAGFNIYGSFVFFLSKKKEILPFALTLLLASSVIAVLAKKDIEVTIKKPNDLMVHGKKLGGILAETSSFDEENMGIVIGLGLNVNMPEQLLKTIDQPATSLLAESGKLWEIQPLFEEISQKFKQHLDTII